VREALAAQRIETASPSGKFWMPMPIASAIAPANVAAGNPAATVSNATPTASPSGKLCRVMAVTSSTLRCRVVLMPSASSMANPRCRCGKHDLPPTGRRRPAGTRRPPGSSPAPRSPPPLRWPAPAATRSWPRSSRRPQSRAWRSAESGSRSWSGRPSLRPGRHAPGEQGRKKRLQNGIGCSKYGHLKTSGR